jgi:hypothetical protein
MAKLYCIKCRGEMDREDKESYLCRKCGSIAYTYGYIMRTHKHSPTPSNVTEEHKREDDEIPLYCIDCALEGKKVLIGYCKPYTSTNSRPRLCREHKLARQRASWLKHNRLKKERLLQKEISA